MLGYETGRAEVGKGRQRAFRANGWLHRGAVSVAQIPNCRYTVKLFDGPGVVEDPESVDIVSVSKSDNYGKRPSL